MCLGALLVLVLRFFFLSNDELIEILSETNDPNRVQPHLKKCFEGISKLIMTKTEPVHISAMQSSETEVVEFCQYIIPSLTNGLVEKWLQQVENQMRMSLKYEIEKCMNAFKDEVLFMNLVKMFASQVLLACNCLYWTSDVTRVSGSDG
jgi:dynein heavy chain